MEVKIEVFYSPLCTHCTKAIEIARAVAEEYKVKIQETNVMSPAGQNRMAEAGIISIPSIFINQTKISGVPTREQLRKAIEKERKLQGTKDK